MLEGHFHLQEIDQEAYQEAPWSFMGAEMLPLDFLGIES
jgi:hypothetical protein